MVTSQVTSMPCDHRESERKDFDLHELRRKGSSFETALQRND